MVRLWANEVFPYLCLNDWSTKMQQIAATYQIACFQINWDQYYISKGKDQIWKKKKNQYANLMTNPFQKLTNSSQPLWQSKHILNHVNIDLFLK